MVVNCLRPSQHAEVCVGPVGNCVLMSVCCHSIYHHDCIDRKLRVGDGGLSIRKYLATKLVHSGDSRGGGKLSECKPLCGRFDRPTRQQHPNERGWLYYLPPRLYGIDRKHDRFAMCKSHTNAPHLRLIPRLVVNCLRPSQHAQVCVGPVGNCVLMSVCCHSISP